MTAPLTYWTLNPPVKWQAGTTGAAKTPFYFSCADCGENDAEIASIISSDGTFGGIGVVKTGAFYNPAMFCHACSVKRVPAVAELEVPA